MPVPPLPAFCIAVLARFPDQLPRHRRIVASDALLDALPCARDPYLWATVAQLLDHLPPHLHEYDLPLSHTAIPVLQRIPDTPDFTLVTLLSLPNCTRLRDDDIVRLRTLHRLHALDLRGCSISSYALVALARGLTIRTGTWSLRLLSLHGCPSIDDHVLPALPKFPLLSAIDLRFTRCTPAAVDTHLSFLGFSPSHNNSLFHPAPLSLALCTLEKIALTASDSISLYSCPPQSAFRLHIDELDHLPRPNKAAGSSSTMSFAQDAVVCIPPPPKPAKTISVPPSKPLPEPTTVVLASQSNASSFYASTPSTSRTSILPLSAQAVQSSQGSELDPLAVARLPPPWKTLGDHPSPQGSSDNFENPPQRETIARCAGQLLNKPLNVDRARLRKRGSDAVADMVHQFTSKRPKIESEFAKARADVSAKPSNPFVRCAKSMFAQSAATSPVRPRSPARKSSEEAEPGGKLRACHSLPCKSTQQRKDVERAAKPLKPITTLKPPILPRELLPPKSTLKSTTELKQTRLAFSREEPQGGVEHG